MSARDTYARLKPAADEAEARFSAWVRRHRLPGDTMGSLRRRYAALRAPERSASLNAVVTSLLEAKVERQRLAARLPGFIPMRDDGLADSVWAERHPEREYRVRPHRPEDGEPMTREVPCVTVIHIPTQACGRGVPVDRLVLFGAIFYPRDDDFFAESLFADQWRRENDAGEAVH